MNENDDAELQVYADLIANNDQKEQNKIKNQAMIEKNRQSKEQDELDEIENSAKALSNIQQQTTPQPENSDVATSFEGAIIGTEGLATNSNEGEESKEGLTIAAQSDMLAKMKEDSKEDIAKAKIVMAERKKEEDKKKKEQEEIKKREQKEEQMMKQVDPELQYALSNEKFTEDMLSMLLKQEDKRPVEANIE